MTAPIKLAFPALLMFFILSVSSRPQGRWQGRTEHRCRKQMFNNRGVIRRMNNCPTSHLTFNLAHGENLRLRIAARTEQPLVIETKAEPTSDFQIFHSILGEESFQSDIESPVQIVRISIPSSAGSRILGNYKKLSRPRAHNRPPCRVVNELVNRNCDATDCTFDCKLPEYIPVNMNKTRVSCAGDRHWRTAINNLCIPRSKLEALCFDWDAADAECYYGIDELVSFFQREEGGLEDTDLPIYMDTDGIRIGASLKRRYSQQEYFCMKRQKTGKYIYKCSKFRGMKNIKRCFLERYYLNSCVNNSILF
ncbi:unnamed protein product [Clavelina lepadiformis]|uniref:Uncharacterized protein n=1 Tax=Clavelina lepadiformis TaxID=159417 RepID=A0ABP0FJ02_CLALP